MCDTRSLAKFEHQPLDHARQQVRLISIIPQTTGTVECFVKHAYLDDDTTPDYRAVSYTWGDPTQLRRIMVNGKSLEVGRNLHDFLEEFRARLFRFQGTTSFEGETQWLWVDQICINQSSISERNHQVRLMSDVYHKATYVYIWLGSSNAMIEKAMKEIKVVFRRFSEERIAVARRKSDNIKVVKRTIMANPSTSTSSLISLRQAVEYFLNNNYWDRLWIVQEIMLARYIRIMCGQTILSWEELRRFCLAGVHLASNGFEVKIPDKLKWLAEHALEARHYTYYNLFGTFSTSGCSNPRDKVYGLQGLVPPDRRIHVDYAENVHILFQNAARLMWTDSMDVSPIQPAKTFRGIDCSREPTGIFREVAALLKQEAQAMIKVPFAKTLATLGRELGLEAAEVYAKWMPQEDFDEIETQWGRLRDFYVDERFEMATNRNLAVDTTAQAESSARQAGVSTIDDDLLRILGFFPTVRQATMSLCFLYSRQWFRVRSFLRQVIALPAPWRDVDREEAFDCWLYLKTVGPENLNTWALNFFAQELHEANPVYHPCITHASKGDLDKYAPLLEEEGAFPPDFRNPFYELSRNARLIGFRRKIIETFEWVAVEVMARRHFVGPAAD